MRNLKLIVVREYLARVRNKTFMIMTFLSPLFMVAMVLLIAYLTGLNNTEEKVVAIHDKAEIFEKVFPSDQEVTYLDYSHLELGAAIDSVAKKEFNGLLFIPQNENPQYLAKNIQFFSEEAPSASLLSEINKKLSKQLTQKQLQANGVDLQKYDSAKTEVALQIETFSGQKTSKMASYIKMFFGGAAGYLLMMFIIIYGNMVMRSVIEEKTNRIVEIIISSVKPMQLMLGKILGTSFAGITQFLIWIIFGGILLFSVSGIFDISPQSMQGMSGVELQSQTTQMQSILLDIVNLPLLSISLNFLVYFILGYFLYSSIYAAIGAAVDSETDTQQFMFPILIPLMLGIYVGFFSVIENPHGLVAVIFSYIPLTSPVVMLMRIPFGVAWWEVALSLAILVATVIFTVFLAAKIYRTGILMYGKKPSYKELFKWLRH
ncbi:ABC transporter permease [Haloflavibacter putidus]|uniref:ABC transporter permease n=1 Tax=Haloflavibacter putidus TaxID=2576776 RepID=A0A507ZM41_9FLAO|nr:ABC transporter permease [Haloflavibacter putidus]TQD37751.1 ABC transporter permease [Haloflavibacter putidus]